MKKTQIKKNNKMKTAKKIQKPCQKDREWDFPNSNLEN